jgi:microcystin degradation protein MlrC
MKIFAAGIATETNTFSPLPTGLEDFSVQRNIDALRGRNDHHGWDLSGIWAREARAYGAEFVASLMAFAMPSGVTVRAAYESLRDEMLRDLRAAMPLDIVLLNLHGAMVAQGYDDCEEDMIRRVREIVGLEVVIGVELDLHCHLSESKIAAADIVVTYKEYPHTDVHERAKELFDLSVSTSLGRIKPVMALFDCRMIGTYPTSREPLRSFVDAMKESERRSGVLSISLGHGFQFADLQHMGAKVLVVTDDAPVLAEEIAREFGLRLYDLRHQVGFDSMSVSMDDALTRALVSDNAPVVVADQSDNPGGGAPGDSTFVLRWLLDRRVQNVGMAILYDPEVVKVASRAGAGAALAVRLGGKLGPSSGTPVDIEVTVLSVREGYRHAMTQAGGEPWWFDAGDVAALRCGSVDVIVSSNRCQCFDPVIFSDFGIDPMRKKILVVKSFQHFYGAFAPIAAEIVYMSGPGAMPANPRLIPYRRLDTTLFYPWAEDAVARSGQPQRISSLS